MGDGRAFRARRQLSAPDEELKGERMNVYGYDPAAKKFTLWGIETFGLDLVLRDGRLGRGDEDVHVSTASATRPEAGSRRSAGR